VGSLRYQFPYAERGSRRPDARGVLLATVRAAVEAGRELAQGRVLLAGGKSMGGRMTSLAASERPLPGVSGIVFVGFPLHPARRPSVERAAHLGAVGIPMLFVQGTRDALADLERLRPVCAALGSRARLVEIEGADHSFRTSRRVTAASGDPLDAIAAAVEAFAAAQA
jgi:predicted alpha/beta-hydrolase family hydrolase